MKTFLSILLSSISVYGCASSGYPFKIDNPDFANSQPIPAEYRLLLVTNHGGKNRTNTVVCAEPSPDAIKAMAVKGDISYNSANLGLTTAQALGELGERTELIGLLRDSLYRSCEAYMNGLLSDAEYRNMLTYWDVYTATLLGIENLTRVPHSNVTISSSITGNSSSMASGQAPPQSAQAPSDKDQVAQEVTKILNNFYCLKAIMLGTYAHEVNAHLDKLCK